MAPPAGQEEMLVAAEAFGPEKLAAIRQLSVDPSNARFMLLVDDLLRPESLPRGWSSEFKAAEKKWVYTDKAGQQHDQHPVYDYYIGAMFMDLGGYAQLKAIAAQRPPTAGEVQQMGQYFGIKPDEEKYIWEVAEMGLCAPLPPGWQEHVAEVAGQPPSIAFRQEETGKVQQEHPLDNYFRELIRRRRRELLRRKKAALKSLQALVKMGMGRRSLLAKAAAADSAQLQLEEEEDDVNFSPETEAALQAAWHSLLCSASQLVQSMQAAAWDGTTGLSAASASATSTSSNSTATATATHECESTPDAAAPNVVQPAVPQAGVSDRQQRLAQLAQVFSAALGPSVDPSQAAGDALGDIQRLAAAAAAAGSNADALAALLAGEGITLPDDTLASDRDEQNDDAALVGQGSGQTRPDRLAGSSSGSPRVSGTGLHSILEGSGTSSAQPGADGEPSSLPNRRPSREFQGPEAMLQRRPSLLREALPFVGATGTTASTVGAVSTSGAGNEPWSLAGGKPDAAGQATAAAARGTAAARAAAAEGAGSSAEALRFVGATGGTATTAGAVSSSGAGNEPWSLAGGKPDAAGQAAAAAARGARAAAAEVAPAAHAPRESIATLFGKAFDSATKKEKKVAFRDSHAATQAAPADPAAAPAGSSGSSAQHPGESEAAGSAAVSSAAATVGADASKLNLVHGYGCMQFPPAAEAALLHLSSLQEVIQEALSLIKSWQQQRVIIALLQQRLQQAASRASSSARNLAAARRELQQLQAHRESSIAEAAAVSQQCAQLAAHLLQVQQDLAMAVSDKQALQTRLDEALAELASSKDAIGKLQAETGSDAAAAEAHASALAAAHKELEDTMQQLRSDLQAATAAFAAGQERCQQLDERLAAVSAELQQEQADKQALLLQLQQGRDELAVLQAQHDQLLNSSGSEAAAASAELQELRISMQQLQAAHVTLQEEHAAAAAAAAAAQEQQRLLQQQLGDAQQQLSELQSSHAALQAEHALQGQQLQEAQRALKVLQESQGQQAAELSTAQQQLAALQDTHAAALRQQQQLESERQQLSMQQQSLQAGLTSSQAEVAAMQAAAKAAEEKRLSQPHKSTQVSAADHADAHWVSGRGVQTGAELDPKATRDVGTPADLGLLSYFFREIKQKQRGGGGAILGYDPADAAKAAEGPSCQSAKSWSGGSGLPPISASSPGGRESKSAAARSPSPNLLKRPATMPSSYGGRKHEEEDEDEGGFNTRPPPWEVRQRVDRRRDRAIKLEGGKATPDGDKWDYALEERDTEIADLKRRLVEAEHKAREAASKAAEELRALHSELLGCKRSLEQSQADNFTLNKDLVNLKLAMQAVQLADGSTSPGGEYVPLGPRMSMAARLSTAASAGAGAPLPGLKSAGSRVSTAPGASGDAGLGLTGTMPRASIAPYGVGQGAGVLSGSGARMSVAPGAYGAGRLSALPTGVGATAQLGAGPAGQSVSPYASATGASRKSIASPPPGP